MVRLAAANTCTIAALLFAAAFLQAQEPGGRPETAPTIKVDTRLVLVPVIIRDKKDRLVRDLKQSDFTLSDNDKPQTIRYFDKQNDAPLTVGLLVDVSGSQRNVLDEERTASSAFLDTLLRPDKDQAFIIQFGLQSDLLADVTGSLAKLKAGLEKIEGDTDTMRVIQVPRDPQDDRGSNGQDDSGGNGRGGRGGYRGLAGTVMYDAIYLASNEIVQKLPSAAQQTNRKALILLTDGDDRGSRESISDAIEAAQRSNAVVYAIYFRAAGFGFLTGPTRHGGGFPGAGREQRLDGREALERICEQTGGSVFQVSSKRPIEAIYKEIAEELRSEYRLGFKPIDISEGYHRIIVDLPHDKSSTIQARDGYYIGTAQ